MKLPEPDMCPNCLTPWKCNGPHDEPPWHPDTPEFRQMVAEETAALDQAEELAARFDLIVRLEAKVARVEALADTLGTGGLVSARAMSGLIRAALAQ